MSQPTVCAICLTADRPELAKRAVQSFQKQTYANRRLLILDSGKMPDAYPNYDPYVLYHYTDKQISIGELRNYAAGVATIAASPAQIDIFVHFDDDDWSHPNRIAEQVALLQSSGAEAVGYSEMLFWRVSHIPVVVNPGWSVTAETEEDFSKRARSVWTGIIERHIDRMQRDGFDPDVKPGEAWMYRGTILGTSLCYWRTTWERRKFEATSYGEDTKWLMGVKSFASSAVPDLHWGRHSVAVSPETIGAEARMVARIHSSNTSKAYDVKSMLAAPNHWTRTPHWDAYCKSVAE